MLEKRQALCETPKNGSFPPLAQYVGSTLG